MKIITDSGIFMADNFISIDAQIEDNLFCILGTLPNPDYSVLLGTYNNKRERDYAYYRLCEAVGNNKPSVDISTNNWQVKYNNIRQEMMQGE